MEVERQLFLVLGLFCVLLGRAHSQANESFEDKLSTIKQALRTTFNEATCITELLNIYNQSLWNTTVTVVNGTRVAQEVAADVDRDFEILTSSLQNNTDIGVKLYEENYNTSCCSETCRRHSVRYNYDECFNATTECNGTATNASYYHATDDPAHLPELEFNQFFGDNVNFSFSSIHVPLPVNKLAEPVLCFAQWTNGLTDVLKNNYESLTQRDHYPQLIGVQFFGGNSSAVLFYPIYSYSYLLTKDPNRCPFDPVDTFNAKSRQWYVNTISGSKHVVILLDTSGSMFELSSSLARLAATEIIVTLSGNDFFYVLSVNDKPSPYGGCFMNRTIASAENKAAMNHLLQSTRLHDGVANFDHGLQLGLDNLKNSTSCHKLIVILSDGNVDIDLKLFNDRAAGTDVRVFSYIVGNHGSDQPLKQLACQNRGIIKRIHSYNDVVTNVHAFTEELNRLVNSTNAPFRSIGDYFNEQFIDSINSDILVTISQPLRAREGGREGFLGVMGLDILGQNIRRRLNARRLGNLGYGFIVNNNAQLLSHPILRGISTVSIYTFNLHDYEFVLSNQTEQLNDLRRKLVSLVTEQQRLLSFIPIDAQRRYLSENVTYYMVPLTNVTFSLALKLPSSGVLLPSYPPLTSTQLTSLIDLLPDLPGEVILQSNTSYCADINYTNEVNSRNFLIDILNRTLMNTSVGDCVEELVTPLVGDLCYLNESNAIEHWTEYLNNSSDSSILGFFIQLSSGLQWCVWKEGVTHNVSCTDLAVINYIALSEHTVTSDDDLAVFAGPNQTMVTVQQLLLKVPSIKTSLGVVGMVTSHSFLRQAPAEVNTTIYYIDQNGYIAGFQGDKITNKTNETYSAYQFFGQEQPQIFEDLLRIGVVKRNSVVGYVTKLCDSTSSQPDTCSVQSDNCCASRTLCNSEVHFYNMLRSMCSGGPRTFTAEHCPDLMYHFACIPGTTLFAVSVENRNFSQTCNSTHFPVSLQSHPLPCPCNNSYPIRMPPDEHCPDILSHYIPTEECSASGQVPIFTQRYLIPILSLVAITTILITANQ